MHRAGQGIADGTSVQTFDRNYGGAGAGGKSFLGGIDVVGRKIAFDHVNPHFAGHLDDGRSRDAAEHGFFA